MHEHKEEEWCHCITNNRAIAIAEEIIQHVVSKYYVKECCMGSLTDVMTVAHTMLMHMNIASLAAVSAREELRLPKDVDNNDPHYRLAYNAMLPIAEIASLDRATQVHDSFRKNHAKEAHDRFDKFLNGFYELRQADEAFDKASKPT